MQKKLLMGLVGVLLAGAVHADNKQLERGRYLVVVGGCNDCHTTNYMQSDGKLPESEWLTGSSMGYSGPWGTTYPTNLRLSVQKMSEVEWLKSSKHAKRPPMPWFNLAQMTPQDLSAMYAYIKKLGAKGEAAPDYVPPGQPVHTPYIDFVPKNLPTGNKP